MNRLVSLALAGLLCLSFTLSAPGIVSDEAGLLSPEASRTLESIVLQWTAATKHQMGIVTIKSLNNISIEEVAVKRFESMGIGRKDMNDGLLFLIAPQDKKLRIEVGYGLEGTLPDGLVGEIRDRYVLPFFKEGKMEAGILAGTLALLTTQAKNEGIDFAPTDAPMIPNPTTTTAPEVPPGTAILLIALLALAMMNKHTREILFWVLAIFLSGSGRGGYGGSSGGFGGGGFGGFGGGMSGGGGSSGGW